MPLDSRALEEFYASPMGQVARRLILGRLRTHWPDPSGRRLLGFGYAVPYLAPLAGGSERAVAVVPSFQIEQPLTSAGRCRTALADEQSLPFPDAFFDCLLVIHGLESAEAQRPTLRELWRVLTPAGRMILVVPNRTSLWAQFETSPFGHGLPYSRSQLDRLLRGALFLPERWDTALLMPPFGWKRSVRSGRAWERIGSRLWPRMAGVHIVEVTKSLYAPAPVAPVKRRALQPSLAQTARREAKRDG
jgi:SAM-dependent methyltransferase